MYITVLVSGWQLAGEEIESTFPLPKYKPQVDDASDRFHGRFAQAIKLFADNDPELTRLNSFLLTRPFS